MQFFWKHLHNNKGDENVSKLIWIVIAFVIGALLLSTMSVAFRTEGAIGGWLSSSLEEWFGEADGRDGSVSGGAGGSGGNLPGGSSGNEATSLEGIVMSYDETIGALTSNNDKNNGNKYTTLFTEMTGTVYETSVYYSPNGATTSGNNLLLPEATVIDANSVPSTYKEMFANGTKVIVAKDNDNNTFYIGVDNEGNVICPLEDSPVDEGQYVIFSAEDNSPIVLTWNETNSTLMSSGKDYTDMFTGLTEGLSYAVTAYPSAANGSNVETDSVLGAEYAVAEPAVDPYQTGTMMLKASNGVTTGVDTSGNILVMNAARPSTGNAVYSQSADGFENATEKIPTGATYYVGVTSTTVGDYSGAKETLTSGKAFPTTPSNGDVFVCGDYEYKYNYSGDKYYWEQDQSQNGWGVRVIDAEKESYGDILPVIAGKPVTNLDYTFYQCKNMKTADIAIPATVTNMNVTFGYCSSLTTPPDMSQCTEVTSLHFTFAYCTNLETVPDLSNCTKVTKFTSTFRECPKIQKAPDLSNCTEIVYLDYAFSGCTELSGDIVLGTKDLFMAQQIFDKTSKPITVYVFAESKTHTQMVSYCRNYSNVTFKMIDEGTKVFSDGDTVTAGDYRYTYSTGSEYDSYGNYCPGLATPHWKVQAVNTVQNRPFGAIESSLYGYPVLDASSCFSNPFNKMETSPKIPDCVIVMNNTYNGCPNLKTPPEIPSGVVSLYKTFYDCTSLISAPTIPSNVVNMEGTFSGCTSLTEAPAIPNKVTNMRYTFLGCTSLKTASAIPNSVTDMFRTFDGCSELTVAPTIGYGVTNMEMTFYRCTSLASASEIPTGVTNMRFTFSGCSALVNAPTNIPYSVETMVSAFEGCTSLKKAPSISNGVGDMGWAFKDCTSLETAPTIPYSVTNLQQTFENCSSLTGAITINATDVQYTYHCFAGTVKPITITGACPVLNELARWNDNVTVG